MENVIKTLISICIIALLFLLMYNIKTLPDVEQPTATTTIVVGTSTSSDIKISEQVDITTPLPNSEVTSPVTVTGRLKEGWFFEANAGLAVLDKNKKPITVSNIMASSEWMTADWVSFSGKIAYPISYKGQEGYIQISNDNPSGMPEKSKTFLIPVTFR